jgi:RNA ligase
MTTTSEIGWKRARELEEEGLITIQKHPSADLFILNYTPKCQYEGIWTEETKQCRGLIVDSDFNVVARPFSKFFNLEQHYGDDCKLPALNWDQEFCVYDKLDGSLGILYFCGGKPKIATRGSFTSEQAQKANDMLYKKYARHLGAFNPFYTYLFEVIYPGNRIVVDYKGEEKLVLLAVVHTETGTEFPDPEVYGFENAHRYDLVNSKDDLKGLSAQDGSAEGVVVRFADGTRIKVKTDEYVRLHRLLTGVSTRSIWDFLRNADDWDTALDQLIQRVPDEFYDWVHKVKGELIQQHNEMFGKASRLAEKYADVPRAEAAALILKEWKPIASATFSLLNGKKQQAHKAIWSWQKPEYSRPFKNDIDN